MSTEKDSLDFIYLKISNWFCVKNIVLVPSLIIFTQCREHTTAWSPSIS